MKKFVILSASYEQSYHVDTSFLWHLAGTGVVPLQVLPMQACQAQVPGKIKKQVHIRTICSSKPKTQWFCVKFCNYSVRAETNKTSAAVF